MNTTHSRTAHWVGHGLQAAVSLTLAIILGIAVGWLVHTAPPVQRQGGALPPSQQTLPPTTTIGGAFRTPASVSLERYIVRVHDQGYSESCGCQASSEFVEITSRNHTARSVAYSPGYICAHARQIAGLFGQDAPLSIQDLAAALDRYGAATFALAPWDATPGTAALYPNAAAEQNGKLHLFSYVSSINDQATLRYYLASGKPVWVLRPVYTSVLDAGPGLITANAGNFQFWHFELIVAYSHDGDRLDVLNSWGSRYGIGGISHETWGSVTGTTPAGTPALFVINPLYPVTPFVKPKPKPVLTGFNLRAWQSYTTAHHHAPISPLTHGHLTRPAAYWRTHHKTLGGVVAGPHFNKARHSYISERFLHGTLYLWFARAFHPRFTKTH